METGIWLYGSNSATDFNDVSDINVSGNMILLYTFTYSGSWSPSMGYILFTTSYSFRYYLLLSNNYGGYCSITNFSIQHGKNGSLVNGTDYTISTSNTNGSPVRKVFYTIWIVCLYLKLMEDLFQ